MKKLFAIVIFLLLEMSLLAQSNKDTLNFQTSNYYPGLLKSLFNKQLNTYSINNNLIYSYRSDAFFIGLNENLKSTITKTATILTKDEQNFSALGQYDWSKNFSMGLLIKSDIYSDDRSLSINQTSVHNSSLYGKIKAFDILSITPFVGYSLNKQVGETDNGPTYGGEILLRKFKFNELEINSYYKFVNDDIAPRKNELRNGRLRLKSLFNNNFQNFLDVRYMSQRKDFYMGTDTLTQRFFSITNNIQSREETSYGISDKFLLYMPNSNSSLEINASVNWRDIERTTRYVLVENVNSSSFDTNIEELRLNLNGTYRYRSKTLGGFIRLQYTERQETHSAKRIEGANEIFYEERNELERQKNNENKLITITGAFNLRLSQNDRIDFSVLHRKLVYDTPSEKNYDDRDELLSLFGIAYSRKITPLFDMYLNMETALNHIVYIFAERSSNNNYKRFIKLNTGGQYKSSRLTINASAEVSANYTVYDFEDLNPNFKSFSFRQFVVRDSSSLRLTERLYLDLSGYIKLSEQGDFKWNDFKTRPSRFLEEVYFLPQFVFRKGNFTLGTGIRFFSLQTYKYSPKLVKIKDKLYNSIGPLSSISIILNKLIFRLNGWYEFIRNEDNTRRELVNLSIDMNWNF